MTLVFPESSDLHSAPAHDAIPSNVSAQFLPSSSSSFSTISHDTSLVYAVPYAEADRFLMAMQEIAAPGTVVDNHGDEAESTREEKKWIMKAAKSANAPGGLRNWAQDSWSSFVDLLKVRSLTRLPACQVPAAASTDLHVIRMPIRVTLSSWPWATSPCT